MLTSPGADDNRAASWQGRCAPRMSDVPCPPQCQAVGNGPLMLVTEPLGFPAKFPGITPTITPKRGRPRSMGDGKREERGRGASRSPGVVGGRAGSRHGPRAEGMLCSYVPFHQNNPSARVPAKPQENCSQESLAVVGK